MRIWIASGIDSTVFLEETEAKRSILKEYYPHITRDLLERYHAIHNQLSQQSFWFDWSPDIAISSQLQGVSRVTIQVLQLGSDIFEEDWKVLSRVPFVRGKTLFFQDMNLNSLFSRMLLDFLYSQGLSFWWKDGLNLGYDFWNDRKKVQDENLHLDLINIKLTGVSAWSMRLVVTDLGSYIPFFVYCYTQRVHRLLK